MDGNENLPPVGAGAGAGSVEEKGRKGEGEKVSTPARADPPTARGGHSKGMHDRPLA